MRFILAGVALLVSLVCFGLGAWQIVQAQATNQVSLSGATQSGAPLIVLPSEVLSDRTGTQTITVSGDGPIVAVVGKQVDVTGWVGDTTHDVAAIDAESDTLVFQPGAGAEATAPNPLGSDLWYEEFTGDGSLDVTSPVPPGFAVLIASTGDAPAPSQVTVTWPLDGRAPWSGPLLVAGVVFLLIALGLLLWALLSMRRGVRPRRSARDEGPVSLAPSTSRGDRDTDDAGDEAPAEPLEGASATSPGEGAHAVAAPDARGAMVGAGAMAPLAAHDASFAPPRDDDATRAIHTAAPHDDEPGDLEAGPVAPPAGDGSPSADPPFASDARAMASEPQPVDDGPTPEPDSWSPPTGAWAAPSEPMYGSPARRDDTPPTSEFGFGAVAAGRRDDAAEPTAADEPALSDRPAPIEVPSSLRPSAPADEPAFGIRVDPGADGPDADGPQIDDAVPQTTPDASGPEPDSSDDDHGRDGGQGGGEPPAPTPPAADDENKWKRPRGRDRSAAPKRLFRLAPVLLVSTLALSGCSASMWPESLGGPVENPTATPTSTIDQALLEEGAPLPAVTDQQVADILDEVRTVVTEADAANDAAALGARFTGAALDARAAVYTARAVDAALPAPPAFPAGAPVYTVPQATDAWPRTVFVVLEMGEAAEAGAAPAGVMLVQETARDPYRVASITQLVANATLPEAAPVAIGAPGLGDLAGTLVVAPEQLAADYGSLILEGDASAAAATFTPDDPFIAQVGQAYRDAQLAAIDQQASRLEFANRPAAHAPLGVGTLDGGAIVAVSLEEIETFSARTQLATLSISGRAAALAGASSSPYGFERVYTDQLLFFVPPAATGGQVQFLGYSQTMTSARQLQQSEVTYG